MPIAITAFVGSSEESAQAGADIAGVIANNLGRSGYFRPLPPESFIEQITNFDQEPRFGDWRQIQAKALVTGQAVMEGGRLKAQFILWDTGSQQKLAGFEFATSPKNWRRLAHLISDKIYQQITGVAGYFDTRIVFVSESGPKDKRVKRLSIMDQDGFNVRSISDGKQIVLTPRFSPNSLEITYMAFGSGTPRVYLYNIETGQREIVGEFPNMSFAPRFSPDGQRVIMSLQDEGNSNIYVHRSALAPDAAAHQCAGDQHRAVLLAGRQPDRVRIRSRRHAADLCDECRRLEPAPHLFRQRPLCDAGVVAGRQIHRLHQAGQRPLRHRRHESRRQW